MAAMSAFLVSAAPAVEGAVRDAVVPRAMTSKRKGPFAGMGCDVHVRRRHRLARVVNRSGKAKKIFCIHAGTYRLGSRSIHAKSGLRLIGAPVEIDFLGAVDAQTKIVGSGRLGVIAFLKEARNVQIARLDISGATGDKKTDPQTKKYGRGINGNGRAFNLTVRRSRIHHNANAGIGGIGSGALIAKVELDHNGSNSYLGCCAGGMKSANDYTIKKSYVHNNTGFGVWQDVCGRGLIVRRNRITRNSQGGVRYEHNDHCKGDAHIFRNIIKHNNTSKKASDGGGVVINSAPNAEVSHNILGGNHVGIDVRGNRGPVTGTRIHDNRMNGDEVKGCDKRGVSCSRK